MNSVSVAIPRPLQYLIVICASVLLFIWGLPHTIALRNTMLGIGAVASLYFLFKYKPFILDWNAAPLILIYCLPVWVLVHYCFFAQEPDLQWLEIKSLWVRVVAGMLIATAMGVLIRKPDRINSVFIFAFFGMSISTISVWLFNSWDQGHFLNPNEFYKFLFDRNKVSVAFFSVVDIAVGCASITFLCCNENVRNYVLKSVAILLLLTLSMGASVIANSKNGVGIGMLLITIFIIRLIFYIFHIRSYKKIFFLLAMILVMAIAFGTLISIHKKTVSPWGMLFADIETAVQIDRYQTWRGPIASHNEVNPLNSMGIRVAGNTYERYAFIAAGSREILRHPLGYGLINHPSFPRWLKKGGIDVDFQSSAHAGWVDLGLAYGFPAIIIMFLTIFFIIIKNISARNVNKFYINNLTLWIAFSVFLAGFVQEITYKHTLEALYFFISLCAACCVGVRNETLNVKR